VGTCFVEKALLNKALTVGTLLATRKRQITYP